MVLILVHTLAMLLWIIAAALALLWAWVLVLLLLGCGRRQPVVKGGPGYLPGATA